MARVCPRHLYHTWFEGEPYFRIERRAFAPLNTSLLPPYEVETLEEDERYIVYRHADGIVSRALKEGAARGTRSSMDQYLFFPVTDRQSFRQMKKRFDPASPARYPLWWDEMVKRWQQRDYPLCLLGNGTIGLYAQLRRWWAPRRSRTFFDDPAFVEEMLDFTVDFTLASPRARGELRFDYFTSSRTSPAKAARSSPRAFRNSCCPAGDHRCLQSAASSISGSIRRGYPRAPPAHRGGHLPLAPGAGFDMDPGPCAGNTPTWSSAGYRQAGADQGQEEVCRGVRQDPPMLESGGFIPHLDHTFPHDIPHENFLLSGTQGAVAVNARADLVLRPQRTSCVSMRALERCVRCAAKVSRIRSSSPARNCQPW